MPSVKTVTHCKCMQYYTSHLSLNPSSGMHVNPMGVEQPQLNPLFSIVVQTLQPTSTEYTKHIWRCGRTIYHRRHCCMARRVALRLLSAAALRPPSRVPAHRGSSLDYWHAVAGGTSLPGLWRTQTNVGGSGRDSCNGPFKCYVRGRPKLSTLLKAYTEYSFCDPLPPSQKSKYFDFFYSCMKIYQNQHL